tara:strand:+ start:3762 stop:4448 length:687 start_codon:yes stop_codon:yes gene_type:complete
MNVTLFKGLTSDEHLAELEAKSEEYNGLYVDMDVAEQRKYVKGKASDIKEIVKTVKAASIKLVKDYRNLVKSEEDSHISRLEKANEPFTLLINDYDTARKVILDAEKASKLAIEKAVQKELDHEFAILLDKSYLADKLAAGKAQADRDEAIRVDATNRETQAAKNAQEVTDRAIALDAANRLADSNNVRLVQRAIFSGFINAGLDKDAATKATQSTIDNTIPHLTINY